MTHPRPATTVQVQLLRLLGATPPAPGSRPTLGAIDWEGVLAVVPASLHPLLAYRVAEDGVPVPAAVRERLQDARRGSAAVLAQRRSAMTRAFAALDRAGVDFAVLKGYALSHSVYPSPELRVMSDVDLWVRAPSLRDARDALRALGWQVPWWRHTRPDHVAERQEVAMRLGDSALMIELHHTPGSLQNTLDPRQVARFWARREPLTVGGCRVMVLRHDDMLVHLALHLAYQHRFVAALPRLVDVTLLVSRLPPSFRWPAFVAYCQQLGVTGWVATTLGTARRLLGAPVSDDALAAFGIGELDALCDMAEEQLWLSARVAVGPQSILAARSGAERLRRLGRRIVELLAWSRASGAPGGTARLLRQLRFAAQVRIPAFVEAIRLGTFRGEAGGRRRTLSSQNDVLAARMQAFTRLAPITGSRT